MPEPPTIQLKSSRKVLCNVFRMCKADLVLIWSDYDHWMRSYDGLKISNFSKIRGGNIEGHVLQLEGIRYLHSRIVND